LDFDTEKYQNIELSLMNHSYFFFKQHFNISEQFFPFIKIKESVTGYHCTIHWKSLDKNLKILYTPLSIDVSLRKIIHEFRKDICFQNGICTYNIKRLVDLKLNAIAGQYASPRTKLRDFFDAVHILTSYEKHVSEKVLHLLKKRKDNSDKDHLCYLFQQEKSTGDNNHIFKNLDEQLLVDDFFNLVDKLYNKMISNDADTPHLINEIFNSSDNSKDVELSKPAQDESPDDSNPWKPRM
jgi:hypothetical protein